MQKRKPMTKRRLLRRFAAGIIFALLASIVLSVLPWTSSASNGEFIRSDLIPEIEDICKKYDICPELVEAQIEAESMGQMLWNYDHSCYGLMQVNHHYHASRASALGVSLYSEVGNIWTGVDYLAELLEKHEGDLYLALGEYNGQSNPQFGNGYAEKILRRSYELEDIHRKHEIRYAEKRRGEILRFKERRM